MHPQNFKTESAPPSYTVGHSIKVSDASNFISAQPIIPSVGHSSLVPTHVVSPSHSYSAIPQVATTHHSSVPVSYAFTVNKPIHEVPVSIEVPPQIIHQQSSQPVTIVKPASIIFNKVSIPPQMKYTITHPGTLSHIPMTVNHNTQHYPLMTSHSSPSPVVVPHHLIVGGSHEDTRPVHEDFGNGGHSYSYYTSVSSKHH